MTIAELARRIRNNWATLSPYAQPYLDAMFSLNAITDKFIADNGTEIVARFLSNATGWRGDTAKAIKAELKRRLKAAGF